MRFSIHPVDLSPSGDYDSLLWEIILLFGQLLLGCLVTWNGNILDGPESLKSFVKVTCFSGIQVEIGSDLRLRCFVGAGW